MIKGMYHSKKGIEYKFIIHEDLRNSKGECFTETWVTKSIRVTGGWRHADEYRKPTKELKIHIKDKYGIDAR